MSLPSGQAHRSYFVPRKALDDFNEYCRIANRTWGEKNILDNQKAQADILVSTFYSPYQLHQHNRAHRLQDIDYPLQPRYSL